MTIVVYSSSKGKANILRVTEGMLAGLCDDTPRVVCQHVCDVMCIRAPGEVAHSSPVRRADYLEQLRAMASEVRASYIEVLQTAAALP